MATDFWKRRLERLGEQFSKCEAVELVMIREVKPVSDAAHKAALAEIIDGIADEAERLGQLHTNRPMLDEPVSIEELARRHVRQSRIKQKMLDECLMLFGIGDVKFGSVCFYAPSLLTIPRVDASRICRKLDETFVAAGSALEVVPPNVQSQLSPLAMSFDNRKLRWAGCLFDIALRRLPGMTHTEPTYLQGQEPRRDRPHPGCWSATLKNVMASSVELIDWLIAVDGTPAAARTTTLDARNGDEAVVTPKAYLSGWAAMLGAVVPSANAVYISYAWGDDHSDAGRQRGEAVERLSDKLIEWGYEIVRDKNELHNGDLISKFVQRIGRGNRVLVILSEKYLLSANCMTELFYVYQRSIGDKEEFLRRVIPVVVDDARGITQWQEPVKYAEHWRREFTTMEPHLGVLGEDHHKRYQLIKQWHVVIGNILGFISDTLHPHGFDSIVKDDFAAVRELLARNVGEPIAS